MDLDDLERKRRWVKQWQETGPLLAAIRRAELAAQTPEESRQAARDMLDLGGRLPPDPSFKTTSGLVEMQRLFASRRAR